MHLTPTQQASLQELAERLYSPGVIHWAPGVREQWAAGEIEQWLAMLPDCQREECRIKDAVRKFSESVGKDGSHADN